MYMVSCYLYSASDVRIFYFLAYLTFMCVVQMKSTDLSVIIGYLCVCGAGERLRAVNHQ